MEAKAAIEQQKPEESLRSIAKLKELREEEAAAALEKARPRRKQNIGLLCSTSSLASLNAQQRR